MIFNSNLGAVRKKTQGKWPNFLYNAYLANTKGFSKYGVCLILGPKEFLEGRGALCTVGWYAKTKILSWLYSLFAHSSKIGITFKPMM